MLRAIHHRLTLCLLVLPILAGAQRITVSEEIMLKDDLTYEIIGDVNGRTLLIRDRGTDIEVRAYDEQMQLRWDRTLSLEKRNSDIIRFLPAENGFHMIYGYRHRGDYIITHRTYNQDLTLTDTTVIHTDVKDYFTPRYRSRLSEDRTKLLLYQAEKETEITTMVYDILTRTLQWRRGLRVLDGSVRRNFRDMLVSNAGDAFILMDRDRVGDRNRAFSVLHVDAHTHEVTDIVVNLGDLLATDLFTQYDNLNNRLVMTGLFNEKALGRSRGLYMITLDPATTVYQLRTVQFGEEFLTSIYGKEVSANKGITNYTVKDVVLRQDGGALVIAEMMKEYARRPNIPGRREFAFARGGWVDYYYEDLIVFSIHPSGTEHWNAVLHKKQYSQDDDAMYSSYFLFKTPEMLRLLFNDEIRQENMVSEYVIRGNGFYRRQSVFSTDYQRLRLRLRSAVQVSHNSCIVPSERSGRLNLVRITFEDKVQG